MAWLGGLRARSHGSWSGLAAPGPGSNKPHPEDSRFEKLVSHAWGTRGGVIRRLCNPDAEEDAKFERDEPRPWLQARGLSSQSRGRRRCPGAAVCANAPDGLGPLGHRPGQQKKYEYHTALKPRDDSPHSKEAALKVKIMPPRPMQSRK